MTSSACRTHESGMNYRQLYAKLYDELKAINTVLSVESSDKLVIVLSILVSALRTNDAEKIQHDIADYNAFKVARTHKGLSNEILVPISGDSRSINQVVQHIINIYVHSSSPDSAVTNYP